jgi:hypothetical protein
MTADAMISSARHLVLHASIVLLFGLLLGAPYGSAINRSAAAHIVDSWRVAHQSLPIAAGLMFAVAAVLPSFEVPPLVSWFISGTFIASAYLFCVALPLAAITGHRGLTRGETRTQDVVFFANIGGAWLALAAVVALVYAAVVSL